MELSRTTHGHGLLIASVFLLFNLSVASSPPQEKGLPYMTSDVKEVSGKHFDYIVVGGGTAGCSLAATLSERFSVLLVERGGSPYGNPLVLDKKYYGLALIQTDEYTSVAQSFISKDGIMNHRGRVLGGSSAELTMWQIVAEFGLLEAGILPYNGFSLEHIEGTKVGATVFDQFGTRHTSADLLKAGNPKNITVLLNATVSLNATRMTVAAKLAFPESKGKLELNGTDPRRNPSVQFNYLAKEKDLEECVKMSKLLERVAGSHSIATFLEKENKNNLMSSEEELRKSCKKNVRTFYHFHGGCTVGSVVDKDYRVYGIQGLRVVDGSTFLESPGTNPMATLLMLGRYQGIRILKEREDACAFSTQKNR